MSSLSLIQSFVQKGKDSSKTLLKVGKRNFFTTRESTGGEKKHWGNSYNSMGLQWTQLTVSWISTFAFNYELGDSWAQELAWQKFIGQGVDFFPGFNNCFSAYYRLTQICYNFAIAWL